MIDDDLSFGASVWGTPSESPIGLAPPTPKFHSSALTSEPPSEDDQFDDFDDFGTTQGGEHDDDDFGDFGDFGDVQANPADFGGEEGVFGEEVRIAGHSEWEPLRLDPMPSSSQLERQVNTILAPLWVDEDLSQITTDEEIRQAEGLSQILVTAERQVLLSSSESEFE